MPEKISQITMNSSSGTLSSLSSVPPSRMPSGPMGAASLAMNAKASHEDSLYYVCLQLMQRLAKVPGMGPYMELAYAKAEEAAEKQAIALSTMLERSTQSARLSTAQDPTEPANGYWNSAMFTMAAGILPAQISHDPVTPVWTLFQQGAPLCLIFNSISPENAIDVVSSDDLKICKMSVYQFLSACKLHLSIRADELFPITAVFSDDMRSLVSVIHSVNFVLDLDPRFDAVPVHDQVTITDSRSQIVKEIIESERKYVYDLETLLKYKNDLVKSGRVSSEDIAVLFPNINEIVDFQRRLLVGLECNAPVPGKYQRIGSVFVHAGVDGFQIYQPWSLYQDSAMDLITRDANLLQSSSSIIANQYELHSFLIKPIQRLCKYPLLLKQLIKQTDKDWPNYSELQSAYEVTRQVAAQINEAQRKSENQKLLRELQERVVDWKGYSLNGLGDLLFANTVTVKDLLNEGHAGEKEVHCYLFDKVIYFFKEYQQKSKLLSSRKKSSTSLVNIAGNTTAVPSFSLNGIVYINKIYRINSGEASPYFAGVPGHFLTLRWRGNRDTGGCVIRFRSEEHMNQWEGAITQLADGDMARITTPSTDSLIKQRSASASSTISSISSNAAGKKFRSISSPAMAMNSKSASEQMSMLAISQRQFTQQAQYENRTLVKLIFGPQNESVHLSVSPDIDYNDLVQIFVNKLNHVLGMNGAVDTYNRATIKLKFEDEDGDLIRFQSDDDWEIAREMLDEIQDEEQRVLKVRVAN